MSSTLGSTKILGDLVVTGQAKLNEDIVVSGEAKIQGKLEASTIDVDNININNFPNISASKITSGVFNVDRIPNLDASKITSGVFNVNRIPNLDASKITSGTFAAARIPNLDASKITSGVFNEARIPSLAISKITNLQAALDDLENNKVDKVAGKGLSTNDYTDADKAKLASVEAQVQGLSSEFEGLRSQVGEVEDRVLGMWKLLYNGSIELSSSSFKSIDLPVYISVGDVLAIEVRYGSTSTSYNSRIIITAIGSNDYTSASSTYLRKIGFTDFDGEYFKNIYFVAYRYLGTQLRVGYYSYLRGRFLPSSNTIEWSTNQTLSVYITRVWKVI